MAKPAHYQGDYLVRSKAVRQAANADPNTRCWRCHLTLTEIQQTKPRARWTAGHLTDSQINGRLAPECSPCNYSAGGRLGNRRKAAQQGRTRTAINW